MKTNKYSEPYYYHCPRDVIVFIGNVELTIIRGYFILKRVSYNDVAQKMRRIHILKNNPYIHVVVSNE